jgi:hypothetical protein
VSSYVHGIIILLLLPVCLFVCLSHSAEQGQHQQNTVPHALRPLANMAYITLLMLL